MIPIWFWLALIGPFAWSVASFMDKYLLQRYFNNQGSGALMIFTGLYGLVPAAIIALFNRELGGIGFPTALIVIGNGVIYTLGFLPYLYALQSSEASRVTPMFQLMPVMLYVLARIFLHETLSGTQILAGGLIMSGAVLFSLKHAEQRTRVHLTTVGLMLLASLMIATNAVVFKAIALDASFWVTAFWQYLGGAVGAGLLLGVPKFRRDFFAAFQSNARKILTLNIANDSLNITGGLFFSFATLLAPIALVSTVNGLQPFILVAMGLIITRFWPRLGRETVDRRTVAVKLAACVLMFMGVYLLQVVA